MSPIDPPSDAPPFRLPREERAEAVPALLKSLLERVVADLSGDGPASERVHTARKRLKRLRGLLRVIRAVNPSFYATENARYRDIGRTLAPVREGGALAETIDAVEADFSAQLSADPFGSVRADLAAPAEGQTGTDLVAMTIDNAIAHAHLGLAALWQLAWPADQNDEAKALAVSARKIVARARNAEKAVRKGASAENLHALRKALKTLWFAGRLLRDVWPAEARPRQKALRALIDTLGPIHDIDVLAGRIAADAPGSPEARDALAALLSVRRARLLAALDDQLDALDLPRPGPTKKSLRAALLAPEPVAEAAE